jgi:hypothetical protein
MDPIMKAWMHLSWVEDYNDEFELLKNQGYLIGSFTNPEAVQQILGKGQETYTSSDEEFEETSRRIIEESRHLAEQNLTGNRRRRRRKIQG